MAAHLTTAQLTATARPEQPQPIPRQSVADIPPWETMPETMPETFPETAAIAEADEPADIIVVPRPMATIPAETGADDDNNDTGALNDDWQWQQSYEPPVAQPIRHALLESLAVSAQPEDLDFASEAVTEVAVLADLPANLSFDGEIHAGNFAVRSSSQVDAWAQRIDSLRIGGLMRLFLLHSSMQLDGDTLTLQVASTQRHLDSERNRAQLQSVLAESFGTSLQVGIAFVDEVPASPQALQQRIDAARRRYVRQVLLDDPTLNSIVRDFAGEWLPDSLEVF